MKILVAVDGSDYSRMAIDFIASRKTLIKSTPNIQVVHVRWPLGSAIVRKSYADEAEKALRLARTRVKSPLL